MTFIKKYKKNISLLSSRASDGNKRLLSNYNERRGIFPSQSDGCSNWPGNGAKYLLESEVSFDATFKKWSSFLIGEIFF